MSPCPTQKHQAWPSRRQRSTTIYPQWMQELPNFISKYIFTIYIYMCVIVSVYCFIYVYTFIYLQIYLHDGLQIQPKLQTLSLSMESYGVIRFASETKTRFFRQMSWRPQQHHGRCKIEEAQLNMTKRGCSFLIVYLQIRTHKVS